MAAAGGLPSSSRQAPSYEEAVELMVASKEQERRPRFTGALWSGPASEDSVVTEEHLEGDEDDAVAYKAA